MSEPLTPPRGPRFSCPACGAANPRRAPPAAPPLGVGSRRPVAVADGVEVFLQGPSMPISSPILCTPSTRIRTGFWPWSRCRVGEAGGAEPQHLHQRCRRCGKDWICKTVLPLDGVSTSPEESKS